ncbi:integrase catalytic domain-containing protein [Trichonephila clavipes]|nr:integrase catalytic domain-containing protein [Trichonephila clavipes]
MTPSEPNSSIPRDANNSVLSASAKVFHPVVFDATNTDTGPNPPNVNNPGQLPHFSLDSSWSEPFSDLKLADPTFFKSGPIDILIGVNIALPMLKGQYLSLGDNKPFSVRSDLGWIVAGNVPSEDMFSSIAVNSIQVVTDELVSNFWKLDSVPEASLLTSEERVCEDHFIDTHVRNEDIRYVVRLPFHSSPSKLGDSRESAIRRFKSLEHSLIKKPAMYSQYRDFMQEYLTLGHMELVPKNDYAKREAYYFPHHVVLRDSSTTKLRVVFDASAKSTSGYSLNDILMIGPRVKRDVYPILLSIRTFQIAVCADLEKMFRQIRISSEDTNWQRILWRDNPKETVKEYRLTTVTYGTSCAPYLSTRTLTQLAFDEREMYPLASFATLHHFYVDDLLSGAANEKEAVELIWQLKEMMRKGGFNLRKWQSNSEIVIKEVAENKDLKKCFITRQEVHLYSKRDVLSEIARVFDPLGLLSSFIVFMKILLQELWKLNLECHEPIPEDLNKQWTTFRKELHLIEKMKIPRYVLLPSYLQLEIHAFCDSSVRAYCTAIYLKCITSECISVSLLTSKTRVAPLKTQSLPRLELCATLLLSNVLQVVLREFPSSIHRTIACMDSTITLAWLKTEPYCWHPFVDNRVSKIQTTIPSVEWCHVSGIENPADLGTRGLLPSQLVANDQWIQGPLWLNQSMDETSSYKIPETFSFPDNALKEKRSVVTCVAKIVPLPEFIDRISSFTKLVRVCAWILRFVKNSRSPVSRTLAVHLELVSDLSTAAFLAALRRFIARRSCPSKIISDNGSNFKGAWSHPRKLVDLCLQEEVQNFLSLKGIECSFNPPYTPHFGVFYPIDKIEACLNSRPLTELSPDPSDFNAFTPAHFLVGGPIHQFPELSQPSRSVGLSERWNLIQKLRQYFWDHWSMEYLHRLQPRFKWWRTKPNLQLGDMVIVEKEKTAPLNWALGRINKLFFGPDQKVRVL